MNEKFDIRLAKFKNGLRRLLINHCFIQDFNGKEDKEFLSYQIQSQIYESFFFLSEIREAAKWFNLEKFGYDVRDITFNGTTKAITELIIESVIKLKEDKI